MPMYSNPCPPLPTLAQLVAILWKVVEPGGGGASLEEVGHWIQS